jgi:hypothetical protein
MNDQELANAFRYRGDVVKEAFYTVAGTVGGAEFDSLGEPLPDAFRQPDEPKPTPARVPNPAQQQARAVTQTPGGGASPEDGDDPEIRYGKYKGQRLSQVRDKGYLKWMLGATESDIKDPEKAQYKESKKAFRDALIDRLSALGA